MIHGTSKWTFSWTRAELLVVGVVVLFAMGLVWVLLPGGTDRSASEADSLAERYGVEPVFALDAYCTKWRPDPRETTVVSADHCHISVSEGHETAIRAPGYIDGAIYDGRLKTRARQMVTGETVIIVGYPARSRTPVVARGVVHLARHERHGKGRAPVSIVRLTEPAEPVISGMSGGAVLSESGEPLAILTTTNGAADLNGDGVRDYSADVVELHDLWAIQP